jgi:hypothetical protein
MSTEFSAAPTADAPSSELQNAGFAPAPDGVDGASGVQGGPEDAPDSEHRETPEHRKASFRFSELSKQIRDLQLQNARYQGMLEQRSLGGFQMAPAQNAPQPVMPQAAQPTPPDPSQFLEGVYDPRYIEAVADFRAELKARALLDEYRANQAQEAKREADQRQYEAGKTAFFNVMSAAEKAGATGATQVLELIGSDRQTADLLVQTRHPVETAEWLADNQEWLRAIAQTRDPVRKAMLVGQVDQHIASSLASWTQSRANQAQNQAASGPQSSGLTPSAVAQPTVRSGSNGAPFNPASATFDAYEAWRKANPNA